ncbi:MAG: hypothetical protein Q7V62_14345 [Actinomycetota bacterium]|nr:hypothetical protein [Actinomycetota bacterium]
MSYAGRQQLDYPPRPVQGATQRSTEYKAAVQAWNRNKLDAGNIHRVRIANGCVPPERGTPEWTEWMADIWRVALQQHEVYVARKTGVFIDTAPPLQPIASLQEARVLVEKQAAQLVEHPIE